MNETFLKKGLTERNKVVFDFVFQYYYSGLCAFAETIVKEEDVAEDIVQGLFVKFWVKATQITIQGSLKNYLFTSVRNRCFDHLKHLYVKSKSSKAGTVSYHVSAFWDFLPTVCELVDEPVPDDVDGISYLSAITGENKQKKHDHLYWEFHEQGGKQAILKDNWKLIRLNVNKPDQEQYELYNLNADPGEMFNVAQQYPALFAELKKALLSSHSESDVYKFKFEN